MKISNDKAILAIVSRSKAMRIPRKRISQLVDFIAAAEKVRFDEVDLAIVTSREMSRINRKFLKHHGDTDVISFNLSEPGENLVAELIVCSDLAVREAKNYAHTAQRELLLYITHGLLHVIGYDDTTPAEARTMHARQEQLLEDFLSEISANR